MSDGHKKHRSYLSSVASRNEPDPSEDFKQRFPERYLVRFHMTLLLLGVSVSGLLTSKILLEFGLHSMLVRYLIAVCVAYAIFFLLIRIWLWYVGVSSKSDPTSPDLDIGDASDIGQISADAFQGGAGIDEPAGVGLSGTGGDFGGGGATDMWGNASTASESVHSSLKPSGGGRSSGSSGGWDFDLGDEGIVLVVLGLLLLVIFGAGAYLVYAAPEILTEAAFQALLAAGLIKASRKITRRGWMGSVLRATCVPFLVVLVMTGIFGWVAQTNYPHASCLADIFRHSSAKE
jgi:hypothetical protein